MSRSGPLAWVAALALVVAAIIGGYRYIHRDSPGTLPGGPEEMPTALRVPGGALEVVTIRHRRYYELARPTTIPWWRFSFCPETARLDLVAYFTYRIKLADSWAVERQGDTLVVHTPALEPLLPVAWDTGTLRQHVDKCWFMLGRATLPDLERDISRRLAADARSQAYLTFALRNGAKDTAAEFVRKWVVDRSKHAWVAPDHLTIDIRIGA